ncbi:hypothetical protein DID88_000892 [Monilinia fructigena]|uniref:Major facilitator superfamily (MFS) profile domain-containing protein n=1 Tax=Monilinia fructigena TaxID=38457 RepID=A0A395IZP5_9HELO|nr:hypothetical protein DID88_000892 [Monilinia fructigena]
MTLHTSNPHPHNQNDPVSETPSTIPVELQLWDNINHEHPKAKEHPHVNIQSKDPESGNVTDVEVGGASVGAGAVERETVRGASDTETGTETDDPERVYQQLLPVDGGPAAWRLLIAAFIFEAILWGFPISFGVFQDYYFTLPQFSTSKSKIALIGTISQGLCYLGAPLSASLTKRFPRYQTHQIWLGLPICILGLVAGSFCNSVQGLIWTQGVMYGCGFVILTYPIISMINEWWIVRKGMAFGLISAASGVSGAGMPFIIQFLLSRYGYKTGLRIIAIGITILTVPLLPLLKGRLPPSERSALGAHELEFSEEEALLDLWDQHVGLWHGVLLPGVYLPSFATSVGVEWYAGRGHSGRDECLRSGGTVCVWVFER